MSELFKNSSDALIFAFRFSTQQYAISPMAKMMTTGIVGSGKGLVALDGAAQAGMILRKVDSLPSLQRSCIIARYSRRYDECKCCGADKFLDEYKEAIANLADWSMQWTKGLSVRGMRYAIIRAFYERGISISEHAEQLNVAKSTVYDQKNRIWAELKKLDSEAQHKIENLLDALQEEAEKL